MKSSVALNLMAIGLAAALPAEISSPSVPTAVLVSPGFISSILANTRASATPAASNNTVNKTVKARQDIDFDLLDTAPLPTVAPDDSSNYDQSTAVSKVSAEISASPIPQVEERDLHQRSIVVSTYTGYTDNAYIGNAAINAPLDCNGVDTFMGSKIFTTGPFDTTLCAAACSSQNAYNLKHPPSTGSPKICRFYNTYATYINGVYSGQYCALYTETWPSTYATNVGQWRGTNHYTMSDSYVASNITDKGEVLSCPTDAGYLASAGADFCSSYISYIPPTVTQTVFSTPSTSTLVVSSTSFSTVQSATSWAATDITTTTVYSPAMAKRAVPSPASISTWSPARISLACSAVATGTITSTVTQTAATPYTTLYTSTTISVTEPGTTILTATSTNTVVAAPSKIPFINIANGDVSGWEIQVWDSSKGVGYNIDQQYSKSGLEDGVEFYFPDGCPARSYVFWYKEWTAIPNQIYEISIDFWYEKATTDVYDENQVFLFYLGGRSDGLSSYSIVQNALGYPIAQLLNNKGYTAACGGTLKAGNNPQPQTWTKLKAWIQPQAEITSVELQGSNFGTLENSFKWDNLTITPVSC